VERSEFVVKLTENIARSPPIISGTSPTVGIILGALGLGLLAVSLYLAPTITALALAVFGLGLPLFLLAWFRPEFGLLAIIFLTSSFVPADIVDVRLPIGGLELPDLVLLGMLGLWGLRGLARKALAVPWWPVGGPLLLFLIMALFSAYDALVHQGVESNWALGDLRILSYYAVFFLTAWIIKQPKQLTVLLVGLFIIADLTVAVVLLQQFLGVDNYLLASMSGGEWAVYQESGAVRIMPAGHVLMHFMGIIAFCLTVFARRNLRLRAFCAVQFVYISTGLLLTFTRAQWVATALGLGLVSIILWPRYRHQFAKSFFIGVSVFLLLASLFGTRLLSLIGDVPLLSGLTERALSIYLAVKMPESEFSQWRLFENEQALRAISERPLTGVALGNSYRNVTTFQGEARGQYTRGSIAAGEVSRFTRYVHNSYLSIAVKMGLPALIIFLWFCVAFLFKGWQLYQHMPDSELKGIVLGALAGFVGLLVWCILHALFIKRPGTPVVGLMAGLVGSIHYIQGREQGSSSTYNRSPSRIGDGE
jgi:O-antigen ligase